MENEKLNAMSEEISDAATKFTVDLFRIADKYGADRDYVYYINAKTMLEISAKRSFREFEIPEEE